MESVLFGLGICVIIVGIVIWSASHHSWDSGGGAVGVRQPESETDSSPSTPKHKSGNEPNRDGIPELIRQQEQTNKHLQKLINDFFWFRIAIILLFVLGGIGAIIEIR